MSITKTCCCSTRYSNNYEPKMSVSLMAAIRNNWNSQNTRPSVPLQTEAGDYRTLPDESFTWFGHSTFLMRIKERNILVDPIFTQSRVLKAYEMDNKPDLELFPEIDVVIISHSHYDHLDIGTLQMLHDRIRHVIIPLGVSRYLKGLFSSD